MSPSGEDRTIPQRNRCSSTVSPCRRQDLPFTTPGPIPEKVVEKRQPQEYYVCARVGIEPQERAQPNGIARVGLSS
jgi:hypothetical protein